MTDYNIPEWIDTIVPHHSGMTRDHNETFEGMRKYHMTKEDPYYDIGYHFLITSDGVVHVGRPLNKQGAHVRRHNKYTIAICVTGNFSIEDPYTPNHPQMVALKELVSDLLRAKPTLDIMGHREFDGHESNECPGLLADMDVVRRWLRS